MGRCVVSIGRRHGGGERSVPADAPRRFSQVKSAGWRWRLTDFQETRLSTLCISYPVRKTCKSNKPPLSSDTKDILGGVVVSTRRQKNAPRPRRGTHSFARVRPSRPSADPLGSHAARHDRCVTREVGRTRASRVSRTPSPPATRARFVSAEALVRLLPRGAVRALGRPERSGNARATRIPLLGSVSALTGSTALPSLSHAPRARARDARVVTFGTVRLLAFFSRSIAPGLAASRRAVAAGSTSLTLFRHPTKS